MKFHQPFLVLLCIAVGAATALSPSRAVARPEFSALQNSPCWKCHVSPMGGGQRNATGFFFSKTQALEATVDHLATKYPKFGEFAPAVNEKLLFGTDARAMWQGVVYMDSGLEESEKDIKGSSFLLMEAAAYLDATVMPVMQVAVGYDAAWNTFEAYGLFDELPAGLYIRLGRFLPPFGLRLDDHTVFTRDSLGFAPAMLDTGVEIGVRPGPVFITAALTNGNLGVQGFDRDGDHYAVTAQAGVRFWKFGLGASYFHNTLDRNDRNVYGGWATFGIWKLALMGEFDFYNQEERFQTDASPITPSKSLHRVRPGSAAFAQLDLEIIRGLNFQARYAHEDVNWEKVETFRDETMGGLILYPLPFFSTSLQYRYNRLPEVEQKDTSEFVVQAHLFF
jgi:hypothetical protein